MNIIKQISSRFIFKNVNFNYRGKPYFMVCRYNKSAGITVVSYYKSSSVCDCEFFICSKIYHTRILAVNFHIKRLIVEMKEGVVQC